MQDAIAIAVAVAAAAWLARSLWRQLATPTCGPAAPPAGADGFVPIGELTIRARKPGRSAERPGS
jgi:hypothetical protein